MIALPSLAPLIIAAAMGGVGGYALAAMVGAAKTVQAKERLARCEKDMALAARAAAEHAAQLLNRAQKAESAAASSLAAQKTAFEKRLKEARSEIYHLSTGRECLSGALRLRLNDAIHATGYLPAPASGTAAASAGSAADPIHPAIAGTRAGGDGATDADIAEWILEAARQYEECRARIDAIRAWDAMTYGAADGR